MSELEEKLDSILSNPQAMEQIMSLARSLGGGSSSGQAGQEPPPAQAPPPQQAAPAQEGTSSPDLTELLSTGGGLGGLLGGGAGLDPKLLTSAARLLSEYNSGDDRRVALLNALRPFVREQRYAKLDKAIQIAKLSRLLRMALELFRASKEDGHV